MPSLFLYLSTMMSHYDHETLWFPLHLSTMHPVFFYPVQDIRFTHTKYLPHTSPTYSRVINPHSLLLDFFRILSRLSIERVFVIAILANTSLCSRTIISSIDLVPRLSAYRTPPILVYPLLSHSFILPLWTLFVHSRTDQPECNRPLHDFLLH